MQIQGKIIIAEDQRINLEALKMNFADMRLSHACFFTINGQQAIDEAKRVILEALAANPERLPIRPINTMLLDF